MDTTSLIIAIITVTLDIGINYWINRRKFYRRNMAGLEGFSSFEAFVMVRFLERIGKLVGLGFILLAIFFLFGYYVEKKYHEKKEKKNVSMVDTTKPFIGCSIDLIL